MDVGDEGRNNGTGNFNTLPHGSFSGQPRHVCPQTRVVELQVQQGQKDVDCDHPAERGTGKLQGLSCTAERANCLAAAAAIAFNAVIIDLVIVILEALDNVDDDDYDYNDVRVTLATSACISGNVVGSIAFGAFSDWSGSHRRTMLICLALTLVSAIGNSLIVSPYIYTKLILWRLLIGIATGGLMVSLSTVISELPDSTVRTISWVVVAQGIGFFSSPLLFLCAYYSPLSGNDELLWRVLILVGGLMVVPSILYMISTDPQLRGGDCMEKASVACARLPFNWGRSSREEANGGNITTEALSSSSHYKELKSPGGGTSATTKATTSSNSSRISDGSRAPPQRGLRYALSLKKNRSLLIGTAGAAFVFDVIYWGNSLYESKVLDDVFGVSESVLVLAFQELTTYGVTLPAYFLCQRLMDIEGPKLIQMRGFSLLTVIFLVLGLFHSVLEDFSKALLLLVYSSFYFFSALGPNTSYVTLTVVTYPREYRSSLGGLSLAAGKAGAVLAGFIFPSIAHNAGISTLLLMCALLSGLGLVLTRYFVLGEDELRLVDAPHSIPSRPGGAVGGVATGGGGCDGDGGGSTDGDGDGMDGLGQALLRQQQQQQRVAVRSGGGGQSAGASLRTPAAASNSLTEPMVDFA